MKKKHPCPDCSFCQECGENRCRLCRKTADQGCKLSFGDQIKLYEKFNSVCKSQPEITHTEDLK